MTGDEVAPSDGNRRLAGQTCIVTGAASGIGRAIARLFARHGANVVVADISETVLEGGEPTVALIAREGGSAIFHRTDVSEAAAVDALVAKATRLTGRHGVIVNNACISHARRLTELEGADWDRMCVFVCCRAAAHQMLTQDVRNEARGRIINLSSQHGMIAVG